MKKSTRENLLNGVGLALAWSAFVGWFAIAPHLSTSFLIPRLLLTVGVSLAMQQYIAGVYHEAAHGNLIQGNKWLNEFLANWFGAYTFLINVASYRLIHFRHHQQQTFLVAEDEETRPVASSRTNLRRGLIRDLLAISALELLLLKSGQDGKKKILNRLQILFHFVILWGTLSYFGSPLFCGVFFITLATLYPLSARIRVWGTHSDLYAREGLRESSVSRNLMSPLYERTFFGNRMLMYHYEHHREPHLSFRECEIKARDRCNSAPTPENGLTEYNIHAPSYFFVVRRLLAGTFSRGEGRPNV